MKNKNLNDNIENNEKIIFDENKLKETVKNIEKIFGKGSLMILEEHKNLNIETISSGSLLLDNALGVNGYPKGRIIEIYGPESSGKTTLALHALAEVQKNNGIGAFIDAEHSLDPKYTKNIGIDTNKLLVSQPDSGEQALDILEALIKTNSVDMIVIDSVAALVPRAELDGEMSEQQIGLHARLMSKALRKLNSIISKTNTIVIFINQLREKVGVIFGNPETTTGGKALKFFSTIRIEVRKGEQLTNNGETNGNKIKVKIVKNKVAPPYKTAILTINYNQGLDKLSEIIDLAVLYNILDKSGAWYSYENEKIGQGKQAAINWLNNNKNQQILIKNKIVENMSKK